MEWVQKKTGQISALASNQLSAWENIAKNWLLTPLVRRDELHLICPKCEMSVYAIQHQSISPDILLASTVAHLRNMHRELDPDA